MKRNTAFASLLSVALLAAVPAAYAAKMVKFSLRNDTGVPLELKIGDKVATLKQGEVMPLKLPVGTRVVNDTATEHHPAGELLVQVSEAMYSNSTITIGK